VTLKENEANGRSSQQAVEVPYCIKLGIKVKAAEGESGKLRGWRAGIKASPDSTRETGCAGLRETCPKIMKKIGTEFVALFLLKYLG